MHFDGHGVYDRDKGLGQLVFEDDTDCAAGKIERTTRLVDATAIGGLLRDHRIPLFVLEACQSAQADAQVTSSVAAELVAAGIGSVVAMSHSVLVETARRFVGAFYPALASGERIGTAMVQAQAALARDPDRSPPGLPRWEMHDWFVPVLFQEPGGDVRLLPEAGLPQAADVELVQRTARGRTPGAPAHGFVGRDRELSWRSPACCTATGSCCCGALAGWARPPWPPSARAGCWMCSGCAGWRGPRSRRSGRPKRCSRISARRSWQGLR